MMFLRSHSTSCPFCYRTFDDRKVAFRCPGAGQPGLPKCERSADQRRIEHFNDSRPVMPTITRVVNGKRELVLGKDSATCSNCGANSSIRLCPHCNSRLPQSLNADSPMFGLVGVRNSGKTVFLSVLHNTLKRDVSRRFNASIDTPGGNTGYADTLRLNNELMEKNGQLPSQTAARGDQRTTPALYEWRYEDQKGRQRSTIFSFYDSAGEDLVELDTVESQQYLKSANGIILLLDPFAFPGNQSRADSSSNGQTTLPETVVSNLTEVIRAAHGIKSNKKIKIPLAIAVSKIDAFFDEIPIENPIRKPSPEGLFFDEADSTDVHEHLISLIQKWGGDNLVRKAEQEFESFRFFGVSALGAEPNYQQSMVSNRGILPHRVVDPLLWLMAKRGFIPTN